MNVPIELLRQVVEEMIPVHKFLGVTLLEAREGYGKIRIGFNENLVGDPRRNRMHGGIISLMLDSAGGVAGITTLTTPEDKLSTIDMRIDYLEPAKADAVIAEGEIVRSGNSIIVTKMRAWHEESGEQIAEGRGVYSVRRKGN